LSPVAGSEQKTTCSWPDCLSNTLSALVTVVTLSLVGDPRGCCGVLSQR